ncbi:MAG: carboxypeptidase-like regulatory domain-containing protein, partial [Terriglobales bacterium]
MKLTPDLFQNSAPTLRFLRALLSFLAITLCLTLGAWAQKDSGSIVGTVTDSSGAVVPDATIVVTEADQGTTFKTKTNSSGEFTATPLRVGRYNVAVERTGFRKAVAGPILVDVQSRARVNVA